MNLLHEIEEGLKGKRIGLTTGSPVVDKMTLGIRKASTTLIAAREKTGKSKWVRWHYIVQPYLKEVLAKNKEVRWLLYTLEEPRYMVEADIISGILQEKYGEIISRNLMLGQDLDDEGKPIFMTPKQKETVERMYNEHIIPLFGEFSTNGEQVRQGLITTYESGISPSILEKQLIDYADLYGDLQGKTVRKKVGSILDKTTEIVNFTPENEDLVPIVIIDDLRLLEPQAGLSGEKAIIDEGARIIVKMTQQLKWYAFVAINHLNRENTNYERITSIGKNKYYPDASLIMGSSVAAQRLKTVITLFNPKDPGFDATRHFNRPLPEDGTYRSVHLVTSREVKFPQHARSTFMGDAISFTDYEFMS